VQHKLKGRGISIHFDYSVPGQIGEVQYGSGSVIISLNPQNEIVKTKNPEAIISLACALLVLDPEWADGRRDRFLPGLEPTAPKLFIGDFSELLNKVMSFAGVAVGGGK